MAVRAVVSNQQQLSWFFDQIAEKLTGKPLQITVKPFKRDRTLPQSAKAHAMIRELALHTGYTEAQMKEIAKALYAPMKTVAVGGKDVTVPMGTSDMNVEEMANFIENLYQLGSELGVQFHD